MLSTKSLIEWAAVWVPERDRARFSEALANELHGRDILMREAAIHMRLGYTSASLCSAIDDALSEGHARDCSEEVK